MKPATISVVALMFLGSAVCIGAFAQSQSDQKKSALSDNTDRAAPIATTTTRNPGERKILYWWDPMLGPSSISDHPGTSAMGMEMVPVYADRAGPDVQIDPVVVQNMGVRTAQVTRGALTKTIRTVGLLSLPEPGLHDVSLKVGGWIDKLYADQEGMHVQKGEPLFEIYSPDLQVAAQELIGAVKSQAALGGSANPELRKEGQSLIESAKRKLRLWDVDEQEIDAIAKADQPPRDVVFRSPDTGHIEDKMVVQGASVQPGMKLLRVANYTALWLDMQVYPQQIPFVKLGQKVLAAVEGISGKTFPGTITFVNPHLDPMTRTLKARATIDNLNLELKPGMYASAEIVTEPTSDAILCPREAVIDTGSRQIVFIAEGNGHFSPRKVRTGLAGDDDRVQILSGLAPDETVVTSGQFLMDVESRTIEATQKLSQAVAAPAPDTKPDSSLVQIYCPMVKADWIQIGDKVVNPYLGQEMSDCGDVKQKFPAPPAGSPLADFVTAYVEVQKSLNLDKLDVGAVSALKSAAEKLPPEKLGSLRDAGRKLADAKDLKLARAAFKDVSIQLIAALKPPGK